MRCSHPQQQQCPWMEQSLHRAGQSPMPVQLRVSSAVLGVLGALCVETQAPAASPTVRVFFLSVSAWHHLKALFPAVGYFPGAIVARRLWSGVSP
jgi:hypothetical protein